MNFSDELSILLRRCTLKLCLKQQNYITVLYIVKYSTIYKTVV